MTEAAAGKTCPKCGYKRTAAETVPDWQCPKCGVAYAKAAPAAAGASVGRPASAQPIAPAVARPEAPSGPVEAVLAALKGYVDFGGRATRAEYWWFFLFWLIVVVAAAFINENLGTVVALALLLPSIAVSVRRLHDIGKSGWLYLLNLVPLIGWLIVLYWAVQPSEGDNDYGAAAG